MTGIGVIGRAVSALAHARVDAPDIRTLWLVSSEPSLSPLSPDARRPASRKNRAPNRRSPLLHHAAGFCIRVFDARTPCVGAKREPNLAKSGCREVSRRSVTPACANVARCPGVSLLSLPASYRVPNPSSDVRTLSGTCANVNSKNNSDENRTDELWARRLLQRRRRLSGF
jgi:hypothetical protein